VIGEIIAGNARQNIFEMNTTIEKSVIEKLIFSYQDAFNAEDISKTVACYEEGGILMPQGAPLAKGQEQ
jgi:ketosteroid isomerase-like protein